MIFIFFALVGGFIYMQLTQEPYIPANAYLKINLAGDIVDSENTAFSKKDSIRDFWFQIKRAKIDNRIKGIVIKISYLGGDFAKIEELGRLLKDFRSNGKKVLAYIESGGLREYYLATFADKIYVFKGGNFSLSGLAMESLFLKNTFSKLGIEAQIFHIGDYKTAANTFTEDHMTPAHQESIQKLLDDIFAYTIQQIAVNRKLESDSVKSVIEESPVSSKEYLEAKLIDGILYEDEVLPDVDSDSQVSFRTYQETTGPSPYSGAKKIAVIFASGEIHTGTSGGKSLFGGEILGSNTVAAQLKIARESPSIKAVVLRIDSPGGDASAAEVIRREAELLAKKKPLVISMSGLAASGGYWIAMCSKHIMTLPQTITGSIGVISGKFILKGLYDKIGINKEILKTTQYADIYSDYRGFSPEEKEKILKGMNIVYQSFLEKVSQTRGMKVEEVDKIAQGRVWSGIAAKELKLVDQLGGLNDAVEEAKKLAGIPTFEKVGLRIYPTKKSLMDYIFELASSRTQAADPLKTLENIEAQLTLYQKSFPALLTPYKLVIK
jgi:protease-4